MVVAAGALEGQAEEGGAEGVHAVDDVGDAELLLDDAALLVLHVEAVEGRREALVLRGVRQQVAGELPRDELVEGEVLVERLDDPVAVRPHGAVAIHLVAVRVGEAREVQPVGGHPLAVARRGEETVDELFVRVR